ncbi:LysR family transcriptional regulator [Chitinilyticum litopenaei]|uniref:LysR family transcriptional regulator n=1 Tax=Chitinilyticum litopenaei TaxID=1121276 RepID=UPI0006872516|nr:LysR family transcriptional regulator [Chitinilyticum litopenaei]
MNLLNTDLNLLCCLHALLASGSVSRAAEQLGVTQPAMSRSLARLRTLFNDPLFVRGSANRLAPTPRAEALRQPLEDILGRITTLVAPPEFAPEWLQARFTLALAGSVPARLRDRVLRDILAAAPMLELRVLPWQADSCERLGQEIDLALGVASHLSPDLHQRTLFTRQPVLVLRTGHPALNGALELAELAAWPHLALSADGCLQEAIDQRLDAAGLQRQLQLQLDDTASLADWLRNSDALLITDRIAVEAMSDKGQLEILPLPSALRLPDADYTLYWSARWQNDAAHSWLRQTLAERLRDMAPGSPAQRSLRLAPPVTGERQSRADDDRIYPLVGRYFPGRAC